MNYGKQVSMESFIVYCVTQGCNKLDRRDSGQPLNLEYILALADFICSQAFRLALVTSIKDN